MTSSEKPDWPTDLEHLTDRHGELLKLGIGVSETTVAKYLIRNRDRKFSAFFSRQVASVGLTEVLTAPASPWQNAYAERVIGTIRRECLDHTIILGERHLRRSVKRYVDYYNGVRTHLSVGKDAPMQRAVQFPGSGMIRSRRHCGGLRHENYREAT